MNGQRNPKPLGILAIIALTLAAFAATNAGVKDAVVPECNWKPSVDVQPCIQAAIQKAAVDSSAVRIPKGQWSLGKALTLVSSVTLTGESSEATLMPSADNSSKPMLISGFNVDHVVISNITLDGG